MAKVFDTKSAVEVLLESINIINVRASNKNVININGHNC